MTHSTSKSTDDSAISSLGELMRLEKERLADEEKGRLRAHEAKLAADQEAAARLVRLEEVQRQAAREAALERDLREKTVSARLDAEKAAILERERVSAIEAAREKTREKEREHELEVRRLELRAAAEKSPVAGLVGYALAFLVLVGAVGVHFGVTGPRADAKVAELSFLVSTNTVTVGLLKDDLNAAKNRADALSKELSLARSRVSDLESEIVTLKSQKPKVGGPSGTAIPVHKLPAGEPCQKGDPMCPTIETR
jgi:hypothetical protein